MKKEEKFLIRRDYLRMSDGDFDIKTLAVCAGMLNNPNFNNPPITIAQLLTAQAVFTNALAAAKNRGMVQVAQKNEARQAVTVILNALAAYCEAQAPTSRSVLLSSGFSVTTATRTKRTLGKAANLVVTPGAVSGTVEMSIDKCKNAISYQFMAAPSPNKGIWKSFPSTTAFATATELTSLQLWDFKAIAIGTNKQTSETEVITKPVA